MENKDGTWQCKNEHSAPGSEEGKVVVDLRGSCTDRV